MLHPVVNDGFSTGTPLDGIVSHELLITKNCGVEKNDRQQKKNGESENVLLL